MICIFLNKTFFDRFIRFSSRTMKTLPSLMLLICFYHKSCFFLSRDYLFV
uniref:Uncharacterized protein n=2 Tax=Brassica oleracea TaxID=3712 RepID=A0A0D3AW82_BRAOL|nr:unnamed protein product [Brassica oleracea]